MRSLLRAVSRETTMRILLQAVSVVAIALGAGLFAVGSYWEPRFDPGEPAGFSRPSIDHRRDGRIESGLLRGIGIGFMTLGALGLAVPWVNVLVFRPRGPKVQAQPDGG